MSKSKTTPTGLSCKCGYVFTMMTPIRRRRFRSFAVVNEKDYKRFLRAEIRVLRAAGLEAKLRAIARSSELVGSLRECPACGRFLFMTPGGRSGMLFLRKGYMSHSWPNNALQPDRPAAEPRVPAAERFSLAPC